MTAEDNKSFSVSAREGSLNGKVWKGRCLPVPMFLYRRSCTYIPLPAFLYLQEAF